MLGLFISPHFYCLQLFELMVLSKVLQIIFIAIYNNLRQLLITAVFMLTCIFLFSHVVFNNFNSMFRIEFLNGDKELFCDTMLRCFIGVTNYGVNIFYLNKKKK
jgi:hypothetical protein